MAERAGGTPSAMPSMPGRHPTLAWRSLNGRRGLGAHALLRRAGWRPGVAPEDPEVTRTRSALLAGVSAETSGAIAWGVSAETREGQALRIVSVSSPRPLTGWRRRDQLGRSPVPLWARPSRHWLLTRRGPRRGRGYRGRPATGARAGTPAAVVTGGSAGRGRCRRARPRSRTRPRLRGRCAGRWRR